LASKPVVTVSAGLGLKLATTVFSSLASKLVATVSGGLASKPSTTGFFSLASKLVAMVSLGLASKSADGFLVEPQNQGGRGFFGLVLKTGSSGLMIWASKSPRRFLGLCLKIIWALVCRLRYKTDGGWCTWHHHGGCVRDKLKTDESIRRAASDPDILPLSFSLC
jgi:hypothetical protein